jgi:hypothetical protein
MKRSTLIFGALAMLAVAHASPTFAQAAPQAAAPAQTQTQPQAQESSPLYRVTVVARTTKAINYRHLSGPTKIDFAGTVLLPLAKGDAKVEGKRGAIRIQAQFEKLQPAASLAIRPGISHVCPLGGLSRRPR